jgi:hypothetical protein
MTVFIWTYGVDVDAAPEVALDVAKTAVEASTESHRRIFIESFGRARIT